MTTLSIGAIALLVLARAAAAQDPIDHKIAAGNTVTINTTGARLIVVVAQNDYGSAVPVLADSLNNACWKTAVADNQQTKSVVFYCIAPANTSAAETFSISQGLGIGAVAFSDNVTAMDKAAMSTTQLPASLGLTPSQAGELLFTAAMSYEFANPGTQTVNAGYAVLDQSWNSGIADAWQIDTSQAPVNPTWTVNGGLALFTAQVAFVVSAGGSGGSGGGGTQSAQTVSFGNPTVMVSATASSGLPVTFTSLTPSVCTVSGSAVPVMASGACTIQAVQPGNTNYPAATATQTFQFTLSSGSSLVIPLVPSLVCRDYLAAFNSALREGQCLDGGWYFDGTSGIAGNNGLSGAYETGSYPEGTIGIGQQDALITTAPGSMSFTFPRDDGPIGNYYPDGLYWVQGWYGPSLHYLMADINQPLTGKTSITITGSISVSGNTTWNYQFDAPGPPAIGQASFMLAQNGWGYQDNALPYRWWYVGASIPLQPGPFSLTVPLNSTAWTSVESGYDPVQFANALATTQSIGLTFGATEGLGHGIGTSGGTATMQITGFIVQ